MNKIALSLTALSALALASCGSEPAPEPTPVETTPAEPVSTLPPPDEATFAEVMATTCQGVEPVSASVCKRAMGATEVTCDYGLGDDTALRHEAKLAVNEDSTGWILADAENICTGHGATTLDL